MPARRGLALVLFVLCLAPCSEARAQVSDYVLASWTEREGLSPPVLGVVQDRNDFIWLATGTGLVRFDGTRFAHWSSLGGDPLPVQAASALALAPDGAIWAQLSGSNVVRIQGTHVTQFGPTTGVPRGIIRILPTANGAIWAGGRAGLHRFDGQLWKEVGHSLGLPDAVVYRVGLDQHAAMWVATSAGLYSQGPGQARLTPATTLPPDLEPFRSAIGRILRVDDLRRSTMAQDLLARFASDNGPGPLTLKDSRGDVWFGTKGVGLWRLTRTRSGEIRTERLTTQDGLSSDIVTALFEDRSGALWFTTELGLHKLTPRRIMEVEVDSINTVTARTDGSIWIGTTTGALRLANGSERRFTTADGLPSSAVHVLSTGSGPLWAATSKGLARWTGDRFAPLRLESTARLHRIVSLIGTGAGSLWICDYNDGVFHWRKKRITRVATTWSPGDAILACAMDSAGRMWVGTESGGLGNVQEVGALVRHQDLGGLRGSIRALFHDGSGALWVGADDGLARIKNGKTVSALAARNEWLEAVVSIVEDARGTLWMSTKHGLVSVDPRQFESQEIASTGRLDYQLYDGDDGLPAPVRSRLVSAASGRDGRLWFAARGGTATLEPATLLAGRRLSPAWIERITDGTTSYVPTPGLTLPPNRSFLQIEFASGVLSSPTKVRYEYRLDGLDTAWREVGASRQATYTNLPPGEYRFHLGARGKDGIASVSKTSFAFTILPTFYQTWWFSLSCAVLAVATVAGAWWYRVSEVERQFRSVLAERARIGRDLHDTLLQALVGAVLEFDSLALKATGPLRDHLLAKRRQLQQHVRVARDTILSLRPPTREQPSLVAGVRDIAHQLTDEGSVPVTVTVSGKPRRYAPSTEQQVLRIGQEAALNALRHANATEVTLALSFEPEFVELRVSDNGCGFTYVDPAVNGGHFGLISMKERAMDVGGDLTLQTSPGQGTEVAVIVPALAARDRGLA